MVLRRQSLTRRYLIMHGLRWLPTGLLIPIMVLLFTSRGITLGEYGAAITTMSVTVFLLELPTGGLADALGRKRVILVSVAFLLISKAALILISLSDDRPSLGLLLVAVVSLGIYRALESGPLDAWFVDALHAADPEADVAAGLGKAGTVTGMAIAAGSLLAGAILAWDPIDGTDPMTIVLSVSTALVVLQAVAIVVFMDDGRDPLGWVVVKQSILEVPSVVSSTLGLVRTNKVMGWLLVLETTSSVSMVTYENLFPVRLEALTGSTDDAAALMGPVGAAAWTASGLGAALIVVASRRFGPYDSIVIVRMIKVAMIVAMAVAGGPAAAIAAFIAVYLVHGAYNPMYLSLLHGQVTSANRATALSLSSMVGFLGFAVGAPALGAVSDRWSVPTGMVVGAAVVAVGTLAIVPVRSAGSPRRASH